MEIRRLFLLLTVSFVTAYGGDSTLYPGEVEVLQEIAKKLGKTDWNFSMNPCDGQGNWRTDIGTGEFINSSVWCLCPMAVCHINEIKLMGQNLSGTIAPEFSKLHNVSKIDLSRNCFTGSIPSEWSSMRLLQLIVMGNKLSGPFPIVVTNISTLEVLHMEANNFSGPIPADIGRLTNLQKLVLSSNPFTGKFPSEIFNLENLIDLRVSDTDFKGHIPNMFTKLKKIKTLRIQGTYLEGPIPTSISSLINLTDLRISDLKGAKTSKFPDLSNLKILKTLILRNCLISGKLPEYLGSLTKLQHMDLSYNNLIGEVPPSVSQLTKVKNMYLKQNDFTGKLPKWILQKNDMRVDASENNFTWNDDGQAKCDYGSVNLAESCSTLPDNIYSMEPCLKRDFSCASGPKYTSMHINCGGKELRNVSQFSFDADQEVSGASTYHSFKNWAKSSTGNFLDDDENNDPYIRENSSVIVTTNLSSPMSALYTTARTSPISLIYYGLCLYNGEYIVELHFAEIVFTSNNNFTSLGRRRFDVYIQKKLVLKDFDIARQAGGVATPIIRTFRINVTTNTLKIHLFWSGRGTQGLPLRGNYGPLVSAISAYSYNKPHQKHDDTNKHLGVILASISIVIVIVLGITLALFFYHPCADASQHREFPEPGPGFDFETFTVKEIQKATKNFRAKNLLGKGGFGSVYKGKLADGRMIAVKIQILTSETGGDDFFREIQAITNLDHPNIVKLYGICAKGTQRMLVYQYLENNSLEHALFGPRNLSLDWPTRRKVILGIARALDYIHRTTRLVHRDIKTSNVLLDRDLNPKLSDFGLAKLEQDDGPLTDSQIAGTHGYMAPEYAIRGLLTQIADVYGFGVVALEVVTGQRMNCREKPNLVDQARNLVNEGRNLLELIHPELVQSYQLDEASATFKLAVECVSEDPMGRPEMFQVVEAMTRAFNPTMEQGESSAGPSNLFYGDGEDEY